MRFTHEINTIMGKNKDAAVGFIGIGIIIVVIVGAVMILFPSEPEKEPDFEKIREQQWIEHDKEFEARQQAESKLDTEEEVLEFIKNYKGKDNAGLTLDEILGTLMNASYPDEDILSSPSTTGYFIASRDHDKEISDRYWKVEVMIETYRETVYFEWIVDTEINSVYPGDEESKSVLDILDGFN